MVLVTDKKYYMDGYLQRELDYLKECVAKKWDGIIIVDGVEGVGKTNLGKGVSYYLDKNFNLDSCVFTPEQFNKAVDEAKPFQAIMWDEFSLGGLSTEATTGMQNALIKKITTIRKKQLFIVLNISWVFMLRMYFAIGRTRFLLHCYTPDGKERGTFRYYGFDKKRQLYLQGRKTYEYSVKSNFYGKFTNLDGVFWDENFYDEKKESAIQQLTQGKKEKLTHKWKEQRDKLILALKPYHTQLQISKIAGMSRTAVADIIQQADVTTIFTTDN